MRNLGWTSSSLGMLFLFGLLLFPSCHWVSIPRSARPPYFKFKPQPLSWSVGVQQQEVEGTRIHSCENQREMDKPAKSTTLRSVSDYHYAKICCVTSASFSHLQRLKHSHLSTTGLLHEGPRASRRVIFELTPKKPFASDSYWTSRLNDTYSSGKLGMKSTLCMG